MILVYEWIRFSRAGFLCENQLKENLRSTLDLYHRCTFQELAERNTEKMVLLSDEAFAKVDWHPENLKIYKRGQWNTRMIVETVLSILTLVFHFKKVMHRAWEYFKSQLAYTMAMFNMLVQWVAIKVDD